MMLLSSVLASEGQTDDASVAHNNTNICEDSAFVLLGAIPAGIRDTALPVAQYYAQRDPSVLGNTMCTHLGLSGGEFNKHIQRFVYYDVELFSGEYGFTKLWCRIKEDTDPFPFGLLTLHEMPNMHNHTDESELIVGAFDDLNCPFDMDKDISTDETSICSSFQSELLLGDSDDGNYASRQDSVSSTDGSLSTLFSLNDGKGTSASRDDVLSVVGDTDNDAVSACVLSYQIFI